MERDDLELEMRRLVASFNALAERVEELEEARRPDPRLRCAYSAPGMAPGSMVIETS